MGVNSTLIQDRSVLQPVRYDSQSATPGTVKAYGLIGFYNPTLKKLYNSISALVEVTIGAAEDDAIASSIQRDSSEGELVSYYSVPALQSEIILLNPFTQGALGVDATLQINGLVDPREIAAFAKARAGDVPGTNLIVSSVAGDAHGYYEIFASTGGTNPTLTVRRVDTSGNLYAQSQAADGFVFNAGSVVQIRANILQDSFFGPDGISLPAGAKFCRVTPVVSNVAVDAALADPQQIEQIKQINVRAIYYGYSPMHFSKGDVSTPQKTLKEGDGLYLSLREAIAFQCWGIGSFPSTISLTVEWLNGIREAA